MSVPPQAGANPTWSWQPGEVVTDRVSVQVKPGTPAGSGGSIGEDETAPATVGKSDSQSG